MDNAQTLSSHAAALESHVCVVLSLQLDATTGDCVYICHSQREHQILQQTAYSRDCQEARLMQLVPAACYVSGQQGSI